MNESQPIADDVLDRLNLDRFASYGPDTPFNQWYDYDGRGRLWKLLASTGTKPTNQDVVPTRRTRGIPVGQ